MGLALHNYESIYGMFPAGEAISMADETGVDIRGNPMYFVLLSCIEQNGLEGKINYSIGESNWLALQPQYTYWRFPFLQCPSDYRTEDPQLSSLRDYFGCVGGQTVAGNGWRGHAFTDGMFFINQWRRFRDIKDGSANTFAIGESVHVALYGLGPGYGIAAQGGPALGLAATAASTAGLPTTPVPFPRTGVSAGAFAARSMPSTSVSCPWPTTRRTTPPSAATTAGERISPLSTATWPLSTTALI